MKNFALIILIAVFSLVFSSHIIAQQKAAMVGGSFFTPPPVYELRCRGINARGPLSFDTLSSRTDFTGTDILTIELSFSPSSEAAGVNSAGLQPGECSWIDRPLSGLHQTGEPWRIRFETPADAQLRQKLSGSAVDRSPTAAERYPDANSIERYLESRDHYWSFYAYNTNQGYFEAKNHRFWKKSLRDSILTRPGDRNIQFEQRQP